MEIHIMHKLIRGPIVAALLLATLAGGAGAAYAGTPDNGGKAVGHATTTPGKAKGHTAPAPTPDPTPTPVPTYQRTATVEWSHAVGPYPGEVRATCDAGDVAVQTSGADPTVAMSLTPEGTTIGTFKITAGPSPVWGESGPDIIGYAMTFVPVDGTIATTVATASMTITCSDVTR